MKQKIQAASLILTFLFSSVAIAAPAAAPVGPPRQTRLAPHTRVTNPSALSVEVLGRGLMYSVNFDQVLNDDLAAGFGYSSVATDLRGTAFDSGQKASMIPTYLNYYVTRGAGSFFGSFGVNVILNSKKVRGLDSTTGDLQFPRESIVPTFGLGYENRGDNGFLFRVAAYGLVGENLAPWLGFSFGYAF